MGDAGSGFLGYMIAACALITSGPDELSIWTWMVLHGAFLADATVTLTVRAIHGERLHEAHRSHAYQWLARRWRSHLKVTIAFIAVNVLGLLPAAWLANSIPAMASWVTALELLLLIPLAIVIGAGRRELATTDPQSRHSQN